MNISYEWVQCEQLTLKKTQCKKWYWTIPTYEENKAKNNCGIHSTINKMTKAKWEKKLKKELNEYDPDGSIWDLVENKIKMAGVCFKEDKRGYEHYNGLVIYLTEFTEDKCMALKSVAFDIRIMAEFFDWVMEHYWDKEMKKFTLIDNKGIKKYTDWNRNIKKGDKEDA